MNKNKILKEFNAHLRNEVHELKSEKSVLNGEILELKDKLREAQEDAQSNYNDMLDTRLENYDLICKIKKLEVEIATLKSQKGSIFTGPSKRETELERQLESERMRVDELAELNEILQNYFDESKQSILELMKKNKMLKAKLEEYEKEKQEGTDNDNT